DAAALDALAGSDVLIPVPDDAGDGEAADPGAVALPVLEQPGGTQVVPVFTSETEMAGLLPFVSRYRLVPLGALAAQWPAEDRKSTRLNSSHVKISYAVFCLKKKTTT